MMSSSSGVNCPTFACAITYSYLIRRLDACILDLSTKNLGVPAGKLGDSQTPDIFIRRKGSGKTAENEIAQCLGTGYPCTPGAVEGISFPQLTFLPLARGPAKPATGDRICAHNFLATC